MRLSLWQASATTTRGEPSQVSETHVGRFNWIIKLRAGFWSEYGQNALLDGVWVYTLIDQSLGEEFTSRAVSIAGRLKPKNNLLQVPSIEPPPGMLKSLKL